MVLADARAELRKALSDLVNGRLSNLEFETVYEDLCIGSADEAVPAPYRRARLFSNGTTS